MTITYLIGYVKEIYHETMTEVTKHPYNEAGRRVKAAIISSLMRYKGVDRTLKELPEVVENGWAELAEDLMRQVNLQLGDQLKRPPREPFRIK